MKSRPNQVPYNTLQPFWREPAAIWGPGESVPGPLRTVRSVHAGRGFKRKLQSAGLGIKSWSSETREGALEQTSEDVRPGHWCS